MKILYVTTIGITMNFFKDYIRFLLDKGHSVDIATNENESKVATCYRDWGCKIYQIDTSRSPLSLGNLSAIKQIKKLVENEKYDIVHCHTPVAAMCCRIACRKARKNGTKVIYTAHGFHFYKGAPIKNWILYYPIEKLLAKFTDKLITINSEDFELAKKRMNTDVYLVNGVGVDGDRFNTENVEDIRNELSVDKNDFTVICVGELNKNKNQIKVIEAVDMLKCKNVKLWLAGKGGLKDELQAFIEEKQLSDVVKILGYRVDIEKYIKSSDLVVSMSIREGLGLNIIEAMLCGKPVIVSNNRGHRELYKNGLGGYMVEFDDANALADKISDLMNDKERCIKLGKYNQEKAEKYKKENVILQMKELYGI